MNRVDVAYALIINEHDHVLLVKNKRGESFDYTLPGGAVEKQETLTEALVREVKEETGLEIEAGEIVEVTEAFFMEKGNHALFFTFLTNVIGGKEEITRPDEILELKWVPSKDIHQYVKGMTNDSLSRYKKKSVPYVFRGKVE